MKIAPIVEGHSEVSSVPLILRRIGEEILGRNIEVARPFRVKRHSVVRAGELEKAVEQVFRTREGVTEILLLIDADDDCVKELGPQLAERLRNCARGSSTVVIANRELESWFLGSKESLRGVRGIRHDVMTRADAESIRGAKEQLSRNMSNTRYVEVDDQPALAQRFDLNHARRNCPSFDRLCRHLEKIPPPS